MPIARSAGAWRWHAQRARAADVTMNVKAVY
jgi:hypothetical protein